VVLVSRWFDERRGTALGIVLTGTSLGGFLIPLIAAPLIARCGWRTAMVSVSLLVWLVLLPCIVLFVNEPENRSNGAHGTYSEATGLLLRQALRTPLFWAFALCAALVFYPIFVTSQQFILYLQSPKIGISAEVA